MTHLPHEYMINLLSPIEKKKILKEYHLRLGVVALIMTLMLEILAVVLLVPSYLTIRSSSDSLAEDLAARKSMVIPGGNEAQRDLDIIKKEIGILKHGDNAAALPSFVIAEVLKVKPEGIDVSSFAYGKNGTEYQVQVGGMARTREDLLFFQRSLKANPRFVDPHYADSFITKKTDIAFQLTLTVK